MKKIPAILTLVGAVFVITALTSFVSITVHSRMQRVRHDGDHDWIHSQLGLTAEQEKALEPIEQRYHDRCRLLEQRMHDGNMELAKAILTDRGDSPRVHEAIEKNHAAMGELQNATIDHVFEMQGALTPEQYDRLLHFTAKALGNLDSEHAGE